MSQIFFKTLFFFRIHKILHFFIPKKAVTVLCFHQIVTNKSTTNPINTIDFEQLIEYIIKKFEIITFTDIKNPLNYNSNKKKIILSFDDGHISFRKNVIPILKKHNIRVNHNIVVNCMKGKASIWTDTFNEIVDYVKEKQKYEIEIQGDKYVFGKIFDNEKYRISAYLKLLSLNKRLRIEVLSQILSDLKIKNKSEYMGINDLNFCKNYVEIGSHSMSHISFNDKENINTLIEEFVNSKKILEKKLGVNVLSFAIPNGVGKNVIHNFQHNREYYKYILTTEERKWWPEKSNIVPRINMYKSNYYELVFQLYNVFGLINRLRAKFIK